MGRQIIFVSGFGPFAGHDVNASSVAVKALPGLEWPTDVELIIEEFPVEYGYVAKRVTEIWETLAPLFVVHVGVHSSNVPIILEQCAYNDGICRPDLKGSTPDGFCCVSNGSQCLSSKLDLNLVVDQIQRRSGRPVDVTVSKDPGRYLCNFCYYLSLRICERSLFIHVPKLNEPYTAEELAQGIRLVILELLEQVRQSNTAESESLPQSQFGV